MKTDDGVWSAPGHPWHDSCTTFYQVGTWCVGSAEHCRNVHVWWRVWRPTSLGRRWSAERSTSQWETCWIQRWTQRSTWSQLVFDTHPFFARRLWWTMSARLFFWKLKLVHVVFWPRSNFWKKNDSDVRCKHDGGFFDRGVTVWSIQWEWRLWGTSNNFVWLTCCGTKQFTLMWFSFVD